MYELYVVIVTYKSSLAGRGLYNTTVFILMYTHVTLINIINQNIKHIVYYKVHSIMYNKSQK